jgi:hypothetical protein
MSIKLVIFTLALVLGMKAHAADLRIPTQKLQEVLEGKSTRTSAGMAFNTLHERLAEISGPIDEGADDRLKQKEWTDKDKFVNIVLSLSGFLGFKDTAALSRTTADYDNHIRLITLAKNVLLYRIVNWSNDERNLNFYEARLRRLKLKSTIRNGHVTLDDADPSSTERGYIWFLLNKYNSPPKSFLYEKAYLVAHYDYFPTGNKAADYNNALELLKDFISPRGSSNKRPRIGSFEIDAETDGRIIIPTATAVIPAAQSSEPEIAKKTALPKMKNQEKEDAKTLIKILKGKMRNAGIASLENSTDSSSSDEESNNDEDHTSSAAVRILPPSRLARTTLTTKIASSSSNPPSLSSLIRQPPAGLSVETVGLGPVIDGLLTPAAIPSGLHIFTPFSPAASATSALTRRPRAAWGSGLRLPESRKPVTVTVEAGSTVDPITAIGSEVDDSDFISAAGVVARSYSNGRKRSDSDSENEDSNSDVSNNNRAAVKIDIDSNDDSESEDEYYGSENEDSDSEHEHAASSSSSLSRQQKDRLIRDVFEELGPKEEWTQSWTYQQIAERAGSGIQKWDVSSYIQNSAPELKTSTRKNQEEIRRTDERIRDALETNARLIEINPGAKILTRAEIAEKPNKDSTQPRVTDAMIAHYIGRRGTDLKGLRAQLAEDRRSRIAEALAQNDADVAKGKRPKTRVQIAADAGEDINAGMVMHYVTEFDTRPKQPQKPKTPKLTDEQKEQIEKLLSADRSMEHKEVARRVSCVSTQVSKHVDKYARHLKKRTFEHYERRAAEEVEASDKKIKKLIRENMNIRDTEICEGLDISKGMLRAFFKRNPDLQLAFRK